MQWGASEHPSHSNTQEAEVGRLKVQGPPVLHRETVLRKATWPHSYYSDPVGQSKCPWVTSSTTILSSGKWSSYLDLSCELTGQRMGGRHELKLAPGKATPKAEACTHLSSFQCPYTGEELQSREGSYKEIPHPVSLKTSGNRRPHT